MKIKIGFSTTNSIWSKIIRRLTKANVSHTYIKFYDSTLGTDLVLHADYSGVQFELAEKFDIGNFTVEEYEIDDTRLDKAVKNNLWHLGKKYNYYKMFNFIFFIMFKRWFVRKMKNPIVDAGKIICVDFIFYILNDAEITNLPIGYIAPKLFSKWCQENYEQFGWKRKIYDDAPQWLK